MVQGFNLKEAIIEALNALGGTGASLQVREYIKSRYGRDWKDIEIVMDDLCQESASFFFRPEDKVLKHIEQGSYSLVEALASELPEAEVLSETPKQSAPDAAHVMIESTVALYSEKLKQILHQPVYRFVSAKSSRIPIEPGVYIIHDDSAEQAIYVGRSRNLRRCLLEQQRDGKIEGSRFRKALGQKHSLRFEAEISDYIKDNCSFQFLPVKSFEEMVRLEYFVTVIMAPALNIASSNNDSF